MSRSRAAREKRIWPTKVLASKVKKWKWILRQFYFGEEIFEAECSWPKFIVNREDSYRRSIYIYSAHSESAERVAYLFIIVWAFPREGLQVCSCKGDWYEFWGGLPPPPTSSRCWENFWVNSFISDLFGFFIVSLFCPSSYQPSSSFLLQDGVPMLTVVSLIIRTIFAVEPLSYQRTNSGFGWGGLFFRIIRTPIAPVQLVRQKYLNSIVFNYLKCSLINQLIK